VRVGRDYRIIGRDVVQGRKKANRQTVGWRPLDVASQSYKMIYNDLWAIGPKPIPPGREFSTQEAAALLCVSTRFLRNEIQAGKLAVIVRRHRYVITRASLVRYAKARRGRA
jgi:Helix-turn-helix domain